MTSDYIKINLNDPAATQARELKNYITSLRQTMEMGVRVKSVMDHNHDGAIFTDIELLYGLPGGEGQTVYDLVNGSIGAMQGLFQNRDAQDITERVG